MTDNSLYLTRSSWSMLITDQNKFLTDTFPFKLISRINSRALNNGMNMIKILNKWLKRKTKIAEEITREKPQKPSNFNGDHTRKPRNEATEDIFLTDTLQLYWSIAQDRMVIIDQWLISYSHTQLSWRLSEFSRLPFRQISTCAAFWYLSWKLYFLKVSPWIPQNMTRILI